VSVDFRALAPHLWPIADCLECEGTLGAAANALGERMLETYWREMQRKQRRSALNPQNPTL
jgi:hypothetical protein